MRRRLSVGAKWAVLYTAVTMMALSIPIGFIYGSFERQLNRDAHLLLDSYLSEVRIEVEGHPRDAAKIISQFTARLNRINPDLAYGAAFIHSDGSESFRVGSLSRSDSTAPPALISRAPVHGGMLEVALSDRSFAGSMGRIRWTIFVAAPLALALSTLCGAWLARRSLRPISTITESAQRISGECLAERIPLRGTNDELDRLAATLNGMFDRLAEAMERLRGFSADAAHQLKSPLAALQNEIEATLEGGQVDAPTARLLEGFLARIGEFAACVNSMLRLARSESGLSDGQAEPVDLAVLLEGVASLFQPLAEDRGISLEFDAAEPIEIEGDVAWLRELFANLVQNAIAHTPTGGSIGIALTPHPHDARITVSDTGEGIDPADHHHIFDRFYRVSPSRNIPGSGLGLALAQQIALAHGGRIEVESEPGRGSVFSVWLPRRDRAPREPDHTSRSRLSSAHAASAGSHPAYSIQ